MDKVVAVIVLTGITLALLAGIWTWYLNRVVRPMSAVAGSLYAVYLGRDSISGRTVLSFKIASTYRANITVTNITAPGYTVLYVIVNGVNTTLPFTLHTGDNTVDVVLNTTTYDPVGLTATYIDPYGNTGYLVMKASW